MSVWDRSAELWVLSSTWRNWSVGPGPTWRTGELKWNCIYAWLFNGPQHSLNLNAVFRHNSHFWIVPAYSKHLEENHSITRYTTLEFQVKNRVEIIEWIERTLTLSQNKRAHHVDNPSVPWRMCEKHIIAWTKRQQACNFEVDSYTSDWGFLHQIHSPADTCTKLLMWFQPRNSFPAVRIASAQCFIWPQSRACSSDSLKSHN